MKNIIDLCKQNYGRTWTKEMIAALVGKGKLSPMEYEQITGEVYPVPTDL